MRQPDRNRRLRVFSRGALAAAPRAVWSEGSSQRQSPRFNLAQVADSARSFRELGESQQNLWTETSGSRKWEQRACSSSTTSTRCGCVLVSCVRKETAAAAANRSTRYPQMDQAQHTGATPDECRLHINDTVLAEIEKSSAEAAAGAGIPQAANSQDGAQVRVGEEGALGSFDGISLVSPKRGFAGSSSQRAKTTNAEVGHDVEQGEGEMTDGERQIRPLLAIRGLEATQINMCQVALEEWQNTAELFVKRVDKKNEEARSIRNEIYQVVGFYSAFQGLLITAVAQSNLLQCHNVGFPLALSALATAAALIGMVQKNAAIRELKMTIKSETPTRKAFVARVEELKRQGTDFNLRSIRRRMVKKSKLRKNKCGNIWTVLFSYETWIIVSLIGFGGLCMAAMRQILCDPGRSDLST